MDFTNYGDIRFICFFSAIIMTRKEGFMKFKSLTPGRFEWNFGQVIYKLILMFDGQGITCEIVLRWMPLIISHNWWIIGLVPSGNKPTTEPMLAKICVYMAALGCNELV